MKKSVIPAQILLGAYGVWLAWASLSETFAYGFNDVDFMLFMQNDMYFLMGAVLLWLAIKLPSYLSVKRVMMPITVLLVSWAYVFLMTFEGFLWASGYAGDTSAVLGSYANNYVIWAWLLVPLILTLWLWKLASKKGK